MSMSCVLGRGERFGDRRWLCDNRWARDIVGAMRILQTPNGFQWGPRGFSSCTIRVLPRLGFLISVFYMYAPRQPFPAERSGSIYPPAVASRTTAIGSLTNLVLNLDLDALLRCAFLVAIAFASIPHPDRRVLERDGTALGIPTAAATYEPYEKEPRLSHGIALHAGGGRNAEGLRTKMGSLGSPR